MPAWGLPAAFPAFCELARQYDVPARAIDPEMTAALRAAGVPCVDKTLTGWYGGELSVESLVSVLKQGARDSPEAASFEVMCHPGFVDEQLPPLSRYLAEREQETAALCDGSIQHALASSGLWLSSIALAARPYQKPLWVPEVLNRFFQAF